MPALVSLVTWLTMSPAPACLIGAGRGCADERDADEAVYRRNGYDVEGCRLRVEFSRGGRGGGRDGGRDGAAGRGPPRRSDFRVVVSGLPRSASWQDLKDHMRRGGDIGYANTFGDGTGVVEYGSKLKHISPVGSRTEVAVRLSENSIEFYICFLDCDVFC